MKTHISEALQDKILNDFYEDTNYISPYDRCTGSIMFDNTELDLYNECVEWREVINAYFLSSYKDGALKKFGKYEYIRPEKILHNKVTFTFQTNYNMSWKDWFVLEEDYASIVTT